VTIRVTSYKHNLISDISFANKGLVGPVKKILLKERWQKRKQQKQKRVGRKDKPPTQTPAEWRGF